MGNPDRELRYLNILLEPIRVCASYKPKLGHGKEGVNLSGFQTIYSNDPFYCWFGLDNPMMYAAHKAAGGMTSIYRQIGIGSEELFRTILQDEFGLTENQAKWSYQITGTNKKTRSLSLDGRIPFEAIRNNQIQRLMKWLDKICLDLNISSKIARNLQGIVFEVRQGYKSKDSKRQNADIANAATAYTQAYLPCVVVMSNQIDMDILHRYHNEKWAVLVGRLDNTSPAISTYSFMKEVVGYDLAAFFSRNAEILRKEVAAILESLLRPE
jgi:hypothetical protein